MEVGSVFLLPLRSLEEVRNKRDQSKEGLTYKVRSRIRREWLGPATKEAGSKEMDEEVGPEGLVVAEGELAEKTRA